MDDDLSAMKPAVGKCRSHPMKRQGRAYVIPTECLIGPWLIKYRTVVSGDFGSTYSVSLEGRSPEDDGWEPLVTLAARWKSTDCAGMQPGDITVPKPEFR
jgi:hypothetical protein